jgi:TolB-like protein
VELGSCGPAEDLKIDSIAVLPFTNVGGDASTDYLSDGITESLIASLTHVPELKVKSRHSVFRYKGKEIDVQKVGNDLGASALVSGRVTLRGDNIEVSVELTSTDCWRHRGKGAFQAQQLRKAASHQTGTAGTD